MVEMRRPFSWAACFFTLNKNAADCSETSVQIYEIQRVTSYKTSNLAVNTLFNKNTATSFNASSVQNITEFGLTRDVSRKL